MIEKASLEFLTDLKANNNREWFHANKKRYDAFRENYLEVVAAFLSEMSTLDPALRHLDVKDCAFRINRDIRFTKDKSPYKTHMGIWMSTGQKNTNLAGYYLQLEPGASFMTGGVYWPEAADLKKIRREIAYFHDDLTAIIHAEPFRSVFGDLDRNDENQLKTAPKDYEKDHPAIEYLRLKYFTATRPITDKALMQKNFIQDTSAKLIALKPLAEFLNRALTES